MTVHAELFALTLGIFLGWAWCRYQHIPMYQALAWLGAATHWTLEDLDRALDRDDQDLPPDVGMNLASRRIALEGILEDQAEEIETAQNRVLYFKGGGNP